MSRSYKICRCEWKEGAPKVIMKSFHSGSNKMPLCHDCYTILGENEIILLEYSSDIFQTNMSESDYYILLPKAQPGLLQSFPAWNRHHYPLIPKSRKQCMTLHPSSHFHILGVVTRDSSSIFFLIISRNPLVFQHLFVITTSQVPLPSFTSVFIISQLPVSST